MVEIVGRKCHDTVVGKTQLKLAYDENTDFATWKANVREKLTELLGLDVIAENACEPNIIIEEDLQFDGYRRIRFVFYSETDCPVPCYLGIPTGEEGKKYPLAISLHGHSSGFHNDYGIIKFDGDTGPEGRGTHAIQAIRNGFAVLSIEQRSRGERETKNTQTAGCDFQTKTAFMLGRTMIGERVWDVSRAIDIIDRFENIDTDRIMLFGDSGGGTATFYAGCIDDRIDVVVPCYAFSPYKASIMDMYHCICNYIPSAYRYFEMQDLTCLIAPRKFLAINGELDPIFPIDPAREAFETVKKIYAAAGAPEDNCRLCTTPKGHYWMADMIWDYINEFTGW
jgi:hypothetical protein